MRRFYGFSQGFGVPNASILQLQFESGGIIHWSSFITNHLPPDLESVASDATVVFDAGDQPS